MQRINLRSYPLILVLISHVVLFTMPVFVT